MKAMILAAGLGTRMRPLTDHTPKPLIKAAGKPLIQYHIEGLVNAGIREIVINTSWLGSQIADYLNDGSALGASLQFSHEEEPLETAGGIVNALPLLTDTCDNDYFIVVNGDVWTNFQYQELVDIATQYRSAVTPPLAHLIMVDNPPQHPEGDFYLLANGNISDRGHNKTGSQRLTFSGISLLNRALFIGCREGKAPLAPLLRKAMTDDRVYGHKTRCDWMDIGTPERLQQLERQLTN